MRWRSEGILHHKQLGRELWAVSYVQRMMILAMAMGHTVGRPVMRMGGGT